MEVCELLSLYEFFGDEVFIVLGFVLLVLEVLMVKFKIVRGEDKWVDKIF